VNGRDRARFANRRLPGGGIDWLEPDAAENRVGAEYVEQDVVYQPPLSPPATKLRDSGVSIELPSQTAVHLTNRIRAAALNRDQTSVLFTELQDRSGLSPEPVS
jgi:hypothetical protein